MSMIKLVCESFEEYMQRIDEKSKSKSQQRAAGMALAAKRGEMKVSELKGAAKSMYKMKKSDLEDFAKTKHKGLPKHKRKKKKKG